MGLPWLLTIQWVSSPHGEGEQEDPGSWMFLLYRDDLTANWSADHSEAMKCWPAVAVARLRRRERPSISVELRTTRPVMLSVFQLSSQSELLDLTGWLWVQWCPLLGVFPSVDDTGPNYSLLPSSPVLRGRNSEITRVMFAVWADYY